jgi:hypothetical protein
VKSNATGNLSVDTSTYLTGNQTIALSGDVSGSGTTSINTSIGNGVVTFAKMANLDAYSVIANNTSSANIPSALSFSTLKSAMAISQSDVSGLKAWDTPTFAGLVIGSSVVYPSVCEISRASSASSGTHGYFRVYHQADTGISSNQSSPSVVFDFNTAIRTWSPSSTFYNQQFFSITQPMMGFDVSSASLVVDVSSMSINGPPIASSSTTTMTNTYGLYISHGSSVVASGATVTNAYGLRVDGPTGATNN